MPRDGVGQFTRTNGSFNGPSTWSEQAASGDPTIASPRHDTHDQDLADALTDSLSRSAKGGMQANLALGGNRLTNVGAAVALQDAPNVTQIQNNAFNVLTPGAPAGNAYTATAFPTIAAYVGGQTWLYPVPNDSTGNVTLDIDGVGVLPVQVGGGGEIPAGTWVTGAVRALVLQSGVLIDLDAGSLYPPGYIVGFRVTNNALDALQDIDISAGTMISADSSRNVATDAAFGKQGDVAFAKGGTPGSPVGGLGDTILSLPVSGTFHVFAITEDSTGDADFYIDTDIAGSNTPAGWTLQRRAHSADTDGAGDILPYTVMELAGGAVRVTPDLRRTPISDSNPGLTANVASAGVPVDIELDVIMNWILAEAGSANAIVTSPLANNDEVPTLDNADLTTATGATVSTVEMVRRTNTAGQIRYRVDLATLGSPMRGKTLAWVDQRL